MTGTEAFYESFRSVNGLVCGLWYCVIGLCWRATRSNEGKAVPHAGAAFHFDQIPFVQKTHLSILIPVANLPIFPILLYEH